MVLPLEKAVNSLFNRLGQKANYKGRTVLFLLSAPDEVVGIGYVRAHTPTAKLQIRVSDAPELAVGDKIETSNRKFHISSEPMKDIHNLIWTVDLCV
ncbi:MAG: hypothetical protein IJX20_01905 [Alphaproteobacteria bacterium]|nr:hypothetical protein [Alphaproteobacteria bacterium]